MRVYGLPMGYELMLCCRHLLGSSIGVDDQVVIATAGMRPDKVERRVVSEAPLSSIHDKCLPAEGGTVSTSSAPALAPEAGLQTARSVSSVRSIINQLSSRAVYVTLSSARSRMGPLVQCAPPL